jgi:hypothetical protein
MIISSATWIPLFYGTFPRLRLLFPHLMRIVGLAVVVAPAIWTTALGADDPKLRSSPTTASYSSARSIWPRRTRRNGGCFPTIAG